MSTNYGMLGTIQELGKYAASVKSQLTCVKMIQSTLALGMARSVSSAGGNMQNME